MGRLNSLMANVLWLHCIIRFKLKRILFVMLVVLYYDSILVCLMFLFSARGAGAVTVR